METRTVIAALIQIADTLDSQNLIDEADQITRIAQELASAPSFEYFGGAGPGDIEGPDDYRADQLFNEADQHDEEEAMLMDLARAEAMDRLNYISQIAEPNEAELMEYHKLLAFLEGGSTAAPSTQDFKQMLNDSGADVYDPFADE
jgi:hypothetical protein